MWRRLTQFMYQPDEPAGSPEPTPIEGGTTPTEPAAGGTSVEEIQKRYDDLRPQYDRTQNELATLRAQQEAIRNDPQAQREFLAELGYDLEEPVVEPPQDLDQLREQLLAELRQEIEPVKQTQAQQAQEKELAAAEAHAAKVFTDLGVDESEQDAVIGLALTMPAEDDGMPPFKQAYERLTEIWDARQAAAAKKRRPTHTFSPSGVAGEDKPDTSTSEGRVGLILSRLQDNA